MIRIVAVVCVSLWASTALSQEWRYVPGIPAGKATITGPTGTEVTVDCGNSGEVGLLIRPDIRPVAGQTEPQAELVMIVDGALPFKLPMTCRDGYCSTGGKPGFLPLIEALMAGRWVEIWDAHRGLDAMSLSGSSRAIGAIRQDGCPGL